MRFSTLLAGMVVASCGLVLHCCSTTAVAEGDVKRVLDAWKRRQDRVQNYTAKWIEVRTDAAGSFPLPQEPDRVFPLKETTYRGNCRIVVDAHRSRFENNGWIWSPHRNATEPVHHDFITVFDGQQSTRFTGKVPEAKFAQAVIDRRDRDFFAARPNVVAWSWHFRPLHPAFLTLNASTMVKVGEVAHDKVTKLLVIQIETAADQNWSQKTTFWVDLDLDYSVVRAEVNGARAGDTSTYVMKYAADDTCGVYPQEWTYEETRNSKMVHRLECSVEEFRCNSEVPEGTFAIKFPPGTRVDQPEKQQGGTNRWRESIVDQDGKIVPVAPHAVAPTTAMGSSMGRRWLIGANLLVLALAGSRLGWKMCQRIRRRSE
jgi:hypothetical protein